MLHSDKIISLIIFPAVRFKNIRPFVSGVIMCKKDYKQCKFLMRGRKYQVRIQVNYIINVNTV